jgi:hypothetical protein
MFNQICGSIYKTAILKKLGYDISRFNSSEDVINSDDFNCFFYSDEDFIKASLIEHNSDTDSIAEEIASTYTYIEFNMSKEIIPATSFLIEGSDLKLSKTSIFPITNIKNLYKEVYYSSIYGLNELEVRNLEFTILPIRFGIELEPNEVMDDITVVSITEDKSFSEYGWYW